MIVPFWSWNLSDTTHVRPHTKFQLVWAINTVFTRGGHNVPPPLTQMCSWDPLTIRVNIGRRRLRAGPGSGCGSSSPTLPSLWAITRSVVS